MLSLTIQSAANAGKCIDRSGNRQVIDQQIKDKTLMQIRFPAMKDQYIKAAIR
ncbi:hypothetical protein D3C76_1573100 [compost metagenome]